MPNQVYDCQSRDLSVVSPVFLVGAERSGSTLLRLMLDHHPEIAFNLESEFIVKAISDDGRFPEIASYVQFLQCDRTFRHGCFQIGEQQDFVALVNGFLRQKGDREGKNIVGATVHYQFRKLNLIWPQARYIYLYRDGRDVAQSVVRMGWAGNSYMAADNWLMAENEWESHKMTLAKDCWIEVQYENLINAHRLELERICEFLGVAFSDRMYDYVGKSTYAMPDPGICNSWRNSMTKREVQLLESKIGDCLIRRGYPLSAYPRIKVSMLQTLWLLLQSRLICYLRKMKDFGCLITLQETLSRRIGMRKWNMAMQQRIDQVIDRNLK